MDLVSTINGTHARGFNSATGLGISSFLVGLHELSEIVLAVMFVIKRLLMKDLARTVVLGNAVFVGEAVESGG